MTPHPTRENAASEPQRSARGIPCAGVAHFDGNGTVPREC